jgi:hypothetical protein
MRLSIFVVLSTLLGCGPSAPKESAKPKPDMPATMQHHFELLNDVQMAIISGEHSASTQRAKELARGLTNAKHPETWAPHLDTVRNSVWGIVRSSDLQQAASYLGRAGGGCGSCHAALAVESIGKIDISGFERPKDLDDYMWQHLWAAQNLWRGLVGPSNEAWNEGATILTQAGFVPKSEQLAGQLAGLAATLQDIGLRAKTTDALADRAELYGEFLGTCADSHQQYRDSVVD